MDVLDIARKLDQDERLEADEKELLREVVLTQGRKGLMTLMRDSCFWDDRIGMGTVRRHGHYNKAWNTALDELVEDPEVCAKLREIPSE